MYGGYVVGLRNSMQKHKRNRLTQWRKLHTDTRQKH